jgi:molecular chaperone DnaK
LDGLPPAPRGVPQVEVTFDIDANGIIHVTAKDKATGKEQKVAITASTNLNKGEVERMVREAEINKATDERRKKLIEARNEGDTLAYSVERALGDLNGQVSASDRQAIEQLIGELHQATKGEDVAAIRNAMEQVQQASYRMSEQAYGASANGAEGSNGNATYGSAGEEDIVEGEFRTV